MSTRSRVLIAGGLAVVVLAVAGVFGGAAWARGSMEKSIASAVGCPRDQVDVDLSTADAVRLVLTGSAPQIVLTADAPRPNIDRIAVDLRDVSRNGDELQASTGTAQVAVVPPAPVVVTPDAISVDVGVAKAEIIPSLDGNLLTFSLDSAAIGGFDLGAVLGDATLPTVDIGAFLPPGSQVRDFELGDGSIDLTASIDPEQLTQVDDPLCSTEAAVTS